MKDYFKYVVLAKKQYKGDKTGHNFCHIKRVLKYGKKIMKGESGVNEFVLVVSILFHDVHRILSTEFGRYVTPEESLPYIKKMLSNYKIPESELEQILTCIKYHEDKVICEDSPIELKILIEADILDNIGRNGLKRTLSYCKAHNIPNVDKKIPLEVDDYAANHKPYSTTHYVYRTMIPEAKLIQTDIGKRFAKKQTEVLYKYVAKNLDTSVKKLEVHLWESVLILTEY